MSKLKVKFEITGLKLEIEGERSAIPEVTSAIRQQIGNLLSAPQAIVDPVPIPPVEKNVTPRELDFTPVKRTTPRARRAKAESGNALDFRHDAETLGNPLQTWTTAQKSIWLLFVLEKQGVGSQLSGYRIAATFNKHFRQAGQIHAPNVLRDLGKQKSKSPNFVGEDTSKSPAEWYLTHSGKDYAQKLLAEAKGNPAVAIQSA